MYKNIVNLQERLYDKFNINLAEDTLTRLKEDAKNFNITKPNGSENLEGLFNRLIANYLSEYSQKLLNVTNTTYTYLKNNFPSLTKRDLTEMAQEIAWKNNIVLYDDNDFKLTKKLPVRISKENRKAVIENLGNTIDTNKVSAHFRGLILYYLALPAYSREKILYKTEYDQVNIAIKNYLKITYKNKSSKKVQLYSPHSIMTSRNEGHSYLIGQTEFCSVNTIKLCNLTDVHITKEKSAFREDFNERLSEMKDNGIQFGISEHTITKIIMNEPAFSAYEKKYIDRPPYIDKKELENGDYVYTFNCSNFQIDSYFFPFNSGTGSNKQIIHKYTEPVQNRSVRTIDIYIEATKYHDLGKYISNKLSSYDNQEMLSFMFADELFLKYLLYMNNSATVPKTHSLYELFRNLNKSTKNNITKSIGQDLLDEFGNLIYTQKAFFDLKIRNKKQISRHPSLEDVLDYLSDEFNDLRYPNEYTLGPGHIYTEIYEKLADILLNLCKPIYELSLKQ